MENFIHKFKNEGVKKTIQKGALLLKEGETERHIYLIETGAVRLFHLTESEEQTIRLGYDGTLINSLSSFIKEAPSEFYLQAIRKTTYTTISKEALQAFVNANEDNLKQYILLLETLITQQIDREVDLLTISPVERLNRVLSRSPHLFQKIPLKYIASYLRMQPETLSRIRKS